MAQLDVISFAFRAESLSHSRITDLLALSIDGAPQLYSATRHDGVLQHWVLTPEGVAAGDSVAFQGPLAPGDTGSLVAITSGNDSWLLSGGAAGVGLQLLPVLSGGSLGAAIELTTLHVAFDTFQHGVAHTIGSATYVYGAFAGQSGLGQLAFDGAGNLTGHAILTDPSVATMAQITATTVATVSGQSFLVTASTAQNGMAARAIATNGNLGSPLTLGTEDGLWISAPSALATAEIGGRTYLILGAAGSQSLSVIEIGTDGSMIIRDHLLDTRDTRFGGVTALEVIVKDGKTYVIAGGADDGISVFVLLDDGTLIHRAAVEDTDDISLNNVSAIAAFASLTHSGLDILVASSSEAGVTQLRLDAGPAGIDATTSAIGGSLTVTNGFDILQGLDGDDLLSGGGGDDILRDGGGSDVLAGGAGADVFLMSADGQTDTITDFTVGEDRIDLSLWPLLRDISQLHISLRTDGMEIRYGDEVLIVQSSNGLPIDYRTLATGDLIGASRISTMIQPGYPGPQTPPPVNGPAPVMPAAAYQPLMAHQLTTEGVFAGLRGDLGRVASQPLIAGSGLGDLLIGTGFADLILGRDGNDTVDGGAGDDFISGGRGNDRLIGGTGADRLIGGTGDDRLEGGAGDDLLTGGLGADTFVFNAGNDRIEDFTPGLDQIILDARLWTGLTSAADLLLLYAETDALGTVIAFDAGDRLTLSGVTDLVALADDLTLF